MLPVIKQTWERKNDNMSAWEIHKIAQDEVRADIVLDLKIGKNKSYGVWFTFPQMSCWKNLISTWYFDLIK